MWPVISTVFMKMDDFSTVTGSHTITVVIFWKQCKVETLLLHVTNRK